EETMRFQTPVRAALAGVVLAVLLSGCREECEVNADCDGEALVCEANQCVRLEVYGVSGGSVQRLGNWPALATTGTPLFDVMAPEDRASDEVILGGYVVSNGTHLLSGYTFLTSDFDNVPGKVALYSLDAGTTSWMEAKGNYSVAAGDGVFFINGQSLDAQATGTGIYGLKTDGAAPTASVVAVPGTGAEPAYTFATVTTTEGVGAFGYWAGGANVLRAVSPAQLTQALSSGAPVDLSTVPHVYPEADMMAVARFGAGVALLRGSFLPDFSVAYTDIARVALTAPTSSAGEVAVGAPVTVVRFQDDCTQVLFMKHLGEDLLLALEDKNGRRLVRVRAGEGASGEDKGSSVSEVNCATAAHDAALGTLALRPGFTVVESGPLAENVSDVAIVTRKP
ncbi:MAG: hypothetical protein L0Y64_17740, partial [Myxococcaceae bacterium]|nr:hypothetical protein [Myxococcaceae bacterium]